MTVIEISKKTVLKALKEEPLKPGAWLIPGDGDCIKTACSVCAVGGVLRECLDDNTSIYDINEIAEDATFNYDVLAEPASCDTKEDVLKLAAETVEQNALAGLSQAFEGLCALATIRTSKKISRHQIYRIRGELASFVKKHFPAKLELDIRYAKPAKGMKILRSK